MSVSHGLDPEQVREVAGQLGRLAEDMRGVRSSGMASMTLLGTVWEGTDVEHFDRQWQTSAGQLEEAAQRLRTAQEALLRQADEQEEASGGTGRAGGSPSPAPHDEPSLWDRIVDTAGDAWDTVTDTAEDAWDWATDTAEGAWDWATGTAADVWDWASGTAADGWSWAGDRAQDAWDAVTDFWDEQVVPRWEAAGEAWDRLWPSIQNFGSQFTQIFTEGRWPRFHEVLTSAILLLGRGGGLVANVVTGEDQRIMHSGTGTVGPPRDVAADPNNPGTMPTDMVGLMHMMTSTYDSSGLPQRQVRVTEVTQADGSTAYIVNVPGTNGLFDFPDSVTGSDNAWDNTSNLELQAGMRSASMESVLAAMEAANIPQGAPVMLMGHSQGGMVTAELVQDPAFLQRYNVTHMITEGAPNDSRTIPSSVQTLALEHTNDIVPKVDMGDALAGPPVGPIPMTPIPNFFPELAGSGDHVTQLKLTPNDGVEPFGVPTDMNAHHYNQYRLTVERELAAGNPALTRYAADQGLQVFLTHDPSRVRITEYGTERVD